MTPKEHYDHHLARVYSWMAGDFNTCTHQQQGFFQEQHLLPRSTGKAIDLGAGHGIQSVALARLGFSVTAIDFNQTLLSELIVNAGQLPIHTVEDDILNLLHYRSHSPELIVCCGDTIPHLDSKNAIDSLIQQAYTILEPDGKLLLTFRDYTHELKGDARFIPVRSDDTKIATCFLEYFSETVRVTDFGL